MLFKRSVWPGTYTLTDILFPGVTKNYDWKLARLIELFLHPNFNVNTYEQGSWTVLYLWFLRRKKNCQNMFNLGTITSSIHVFNLFECDIAYIGDTKNCEWWIEGAKNCQEYWIEGVKMGKCEKNRLNHVTVSSPFIIYGKLLIVSCGRSFITI